jgi:hypothetical protein
VTIRADDNRILDGNKIEYDIGNQSTIRIDDNMDLAVRTWLLCGVIGAHNAFTIYTTF